MLTREQIELAKRYNAWRRQIDDDEPRLEMPDPKAIGEAIDALVEHAERSPVTADGVVVDDGDKVYCWSGMFGQVIEYTVVCDKFEALSHPSEDLVRRQTVSRCYSTLEAARAAKGGG